MRSPAFVVSILIHGAVAAALIAAASKAEIKTAIAIAVVGEKKESKPPPPKPKPRPVSRSEEPKPPPRAQTATQTPGAPSAAPQAVESQAPELSSLVITNADAPGVEIPVPRAVAPPAKVAALTPRLPDERRERRDVERVCDELPSKPQPISRTVEIEYSPQARSEGVEGRLVLRLTIAADGTVERVEVVSGVHPALDAMAIASVKQWRFRPAQACGRPVAGGVYTLARKFELGD